MTTCGGNLPNGYTLRAFLQEEGIRRHQYIPDNGKSINVGTTPTDSIPDDELFGDAKNYLASISDRLAASQPVGERIILPDSVPTVWNPLNGQPYYGAKRGRAWHYRTRRTVGLIRRKVVNSSGIPVRCATYDGHGRTGKPFGIDVLLSTFTQQCNSQEEAAGDALCNWVIKNWSRLNVNYVIWWNWMNDGNGWFDYEPVRRKWDSGSQNLVASRHLDHLHIQIDSPFIVGNE